MLTVSCEFYAKIEWHSHPESRLAYKLALASVDGLSRDIRDHIYFSEPLARTRISIENAVADIILQ